MTLTEILKNPDIAHILANLLRKKLPAAYEIEAMEGQNVVYATSVFPIVGTFTKKTLEFRIEVKRFGKIFDIDITFGADASDNEQIKTMRGVVDLILNIDNDPEAWVELIRPVADD